MPTIADMDPKPHNQPASENGMGLNKETVVKIDNTLKSIPPARSKDAKSAAARLLAPAGQSAVSDEVELTATSERMRQLESELGGVDISDAAKVEAIRQAIADGKFKVDEEVVAEGLIQESIATIGRRSRQ
jgi:negative regulator of flagellin synthesis FlgM